MFPTAFPHVFFAYSGINLLRIEARGSDAITSSLSMLSYLYFEAFSKSSANYDEISFGIK